MPVTVSSFSTTPNGFSQEQIYLFNKADIIFCETRPTLDFVMAGLGVDLDSKEIVSVYETLHSEPTMDQDEKIAQYIADNLDKEIVIVSDDGFPNIVDPYSAVISHLVLKNIHINITPNVSSVLSATILAGLGGENFFFGGIVVRWEDYESKLLSLQEIS